CRGPSPWRRPLYRHCGEPCFRRVAARCPPPAYQRGDQRRFRPRRNPRAVIEAVHAPRMAGPAQMSTAPDVLIVDDDPSLAEMLSLHLEDIGLASKAVTRGADLWPSLKKSPPRVVLLDQHLPDGLGINILAQLHTEHPGLPVIMITGKHDMGLAIEAIRAGA